VLGQRILPDGLEGAAVTSMTGGASGVRALADRRHQVSCGADAVFECRDAIIDLAEQPLVLKGWPASAEPNRAVVAYDLERSPIFAVAAAVAEAE
jgi:hypothetical protein